MKYIIGGVFLLASVGILIYNIINNCYFWDVSVTDIMNLFFVIIVSYYLVEKNNYFNRRREKFNYIIQKIQAMLMDERLCLNTNELEKRNAMILQRNLMNKIILIKECREVKDKDIKIMLEQLEKSVINLRELYSESLASDTKVDITNKMKSAISIADDKCDQMQIILFK